jgi:protein arginine kinase
VTEQQNEMLAYQQGTVVSSRIRLARNLDGYPFPSHFSEDRQPREIIRRVTTGFSRLIEDFRLYYMDSIDEQTASLLKEAHLISPALIKGAHNSAALISEDKSVSIMINEEDHLREQCIMKGFELEKAYERMSEIDSNIAMSIKFAYDEQLGYLTACPTNLGTGLRASVMMFLPALTINGMMPKLVRYISRKGLTARGVYGEGSQSEGYLYQISNEVTLGSSEESIIKLVKEIVGKIIELECAERFHLAMSSAAPDLEDKCLRAYGVLANCAKLSSEECLSLATYVKLGVCMQFLKTEDISLIDELMEQMRPCAIEANAGRTLSPIDRDLYRAEYAGKFITHAVHRR